MPTLVETNRIARIQQKRSCELALNGTLVKAPTTNTTKRSRERARCSSIACHTPSAH
jgi:hypothetical protein